MEVLAELAEGFHLSGLAMTVALILARVTPLVTLAPFLGGPTLSAAARTVVALALTLAVYPAAAGGGPIPPDAGLFLVLMLKEAVVGTALGLLAAVAFHTLTMAGQLIDQARGASSSAGPSPLTGEQQSPLASLHLLLGVVLFLLLGGHRVFLAAVAGSYEAIPLAQLPLAPSGLRAMALLLARLVGGALAVAVMLAAPAVVAILLTDLGLGLLGRAAPQLGTSFLAMPLRAALGLAVSLLALSFLADELVAAAAQVIDLVRQASELLRQAP